MVADPYGIVAAYDRDKARGIAPAPVRQNVQTPMYVKTYKDVGVAYVLWLLLGFVGGHRFYLGKPGSAVFYMLTGGGFVIGWLIDLFTIPSMVRQANGQP